MDYESDWLGISVKMNTYKEAIRISKLYKQKYPNAKIVWGGPHVSCSHHKIKKENPDIELFIGEWDHTQDLDSLAFPDYSNFDSYSYLIEHWQKGLLPYPIMTSRGCPYFCAYCATHSISGRKWRARSARNCYEELKSASERWKIKSFDVLDDCFNINKKRVLEFCEMIKPLRLTWSCGNGIRADRFDEEMAQAMSEAGCKHVSFGIESVNPEVLKAIRKGETIDQIEKTIDIAKKHFDVSGFFIIGLPNSSYESDLSSVRWAIKKRISAHFQYLVPFEGTGLRETLYKDKNYDDALTFGLTAQPVSNEYPKELQRKIYQMTAFMRPEASQRSFCVNAWDAMRLIWKLDFKSLPALLVSGLKKFGNTTKKRSLVRTHK
jgi:radical SAM superfamily enzyme YgiQ (UPF0313 family)